MASNFTGRNLMSRALAVSFIITNFATFAMSSWYQNRKFEDLYSFKGADFPLNPSVPWSTKGVGVHFFGDLLESVKIVSTSGSPYIKASGTYLPFTYAVLRIFGSIDYPLLCLMFLISVAVGIAVVTQISYKLNSNIGRIDILIILLSWPMLSGIDRGNIQVFLLLLLVLAIVLFSMGHNVASAITIGLIGAMKGYPILFLLIFLGRSQWRKNIFTGLSTFAIATTVSLLTFTGGFMPNLRGFVRNFTASETAGYFPVAYNNSLNGLFESVVRLNLFGMGNFFDTVNNYQRPISIILILLTIITCTMTTNMEVRLLLIACVLILTAPYSPAYMLGLLMAPAVGLYLVSRQRRSHTVLIVLVAVLLSPKVFPIANLGTPFDPLTPTLNSVLNPLILLTILVSLVIFTLSRHPILKSRRTNTPTFLSKVDEH